MALAELILIHGSEEVLADRALAEALTARVEFERTTLNGDEIELGRYSEVIAPSLFADKRVVVIRDLQDAQAEVAEEIIHSLDQLDPNLHLIFIHRGGVKGKGLVEKIKKAKAEVITCEPMKKITDKQTFVREEFARHGRKISSGGVSALIDATGSDMRELAAACSQIAFDTIASKATIDEDDIAKYYQGRVEATGFDVADAAVAGDPQGALIALRNALDSGTDPIMIISAIATSVRTIAKVSGAPRNANPYQLASSLKLAPWQIEKARRQMSKWAPGMITFSIKELARADLAVKGAEADPIYALERTVVAIAKKVAGK
ncbi:MAG: DNA polymerase III subunit delta [Actinobacteria bacterium]|jgi:DNA polymerase-3 subunit delta|nr:DNA polymerase III subunit delta [Actinomycetota bacterium]NCZ73041.1 DNA polymerase III subunit delta [Actinomycetota bacterium]NDA41461.1 DNA polymerase III subunit delta [Actinomycetota bacterium]NDC52112.1 DNA polymerase III subunit delta [Actinomycetota bacterium]NDE50890.1 DNA polymerase III subunit delta [Actinomycetota bacterium]